MGQANVRRWVDDILPLLDGDDDPLGVDTFATHRLPLAQAPEAYATFQAKRDGAVKLLSNPERAPPVRGDGRVRRGDGRGCSHLDRPGSRGR